MDWRHHAACLDAAAIRRVEQARQRGRTSTPALYLRSATQQYLLGSSHRALSISLERPGETPEEGLATVIVQNTAPWTYLGDRPVNPNPDASFDLGLDVLALRRLRLPSTMRTAAQILSRKPNPRGRHVLRLHDLDELTLVSTQPQPFQLDGDYLGDRERVRFVSVPDALRVLC